MPHSSFELFDAFSHGKKVSLFSLYVVERKYLAAAKAGRHTGFPGWKDGIKAPNANYDGSEIWKYAG